VLVMELPVVVGVDGSEPAFRAADWAADEAARHDLPLRVIHAWPWEHYEGATLVGGLGRTEGRAIAESIVATAAQRVRSRHPGLKVVTDVAAQDTVAALLREGTNATALVTGVRGRGEIADLLLGSVSLAVASRAQCPVIVVRGDEPAAQGRHGRILLGLGDTGANAPALHFAFQEAVKRDCMLDVVRAWRTPAQRNSTHAAHAEEPTHTHEERERDLFDATIDPAIAVYPDARVRRALVEGPAAHVLVARTASADLLVVGARRRPGQFGMQLGRVAHRALHHADCPVAVVPQPL
jgi:nucleotide-binding universal stress UspA family protein